jgi:hypothetical protein
LRSFMRCINVNENCLTPKPDMPPACPITGTDG